jgi:DNA-binding NarL/FixJ family response regulator
MIKVGVIEDNATLRSSVSCLINSMEDMNCNLSLPTLQHVISELAKNTPDIILLDIDLPVISGIEGVKLIKASFPDIQVLMFTVFEEDEKIFAAIKYGASGYLLKKTSLMKLLLPLGS